MFTISEHKTILQYFGIIIILSILSQTLCQQRLTNPCANKKKCNECIQTKSCAWCFQPGFDDKERCFQPTSYVKQKCESRYTSNPINTKKLKTDDHLTLAGSKSFTKKITQIKPQRIGLKLRINQEYHFNFKYSQAEDYPIDLYYLMDLSKSMEDDKNKLSHLGDTLAKVMKNITSNFRLGFGSFVDKVLMPYVSTVPQKLKHPCDGCEAPYGFRNHMPLSTKTTEFSEKVRKAAVSGNLDSPEGGFDAIMQAVVCREQIKWREQARRLLVFSTDAGFHFAGDGKLAGVITPNDGECHLDKEGFEYTESSRLDYPSISQINLKVKQNAINIIFAVTSEQISVYKELSEIVEGSTSAQLSYDSSNIVSLIQTQYNKISSSVEMKDNSSSAVEITYYSKCLTSKDLKETNKCDGLKVGDLVEFEVKIVVKSCPKDPRLWNQILQIYPVGINESLIIDLEMLCSCDCEKSTHPLYKQNSDQCSDHGTYQCGICSCNENFVGRICECSATAAHNDDRMGCRPDNTTTNDCNRRGNCLCNVCECEKRENPNEIISGTYCECDNFSCDRNNDLVCSGSEQGICNCGICECLSGWIGSACDCRDTNSTCLPPNGGPICSGHGVCECGECKCDVTEKGRYSGKYCEKCQTCAGRCNEFKDCVTCQVYKTGPLEKDGTCLSNCTLFTTSTEATIVVNEEDDEHLCSYYDDDDCRFFFVYSENGENVNVRTQKERDCPTKVFMLGIIVAVVGAIVLMGLAVLLLWKLLTTIHDRREFARFEALERKVKWDAGQNPIFKSTTSTFSNPTYAGKN